MSHRSFLTRLLAFGAALSVVAVPSDADGAVILRGRRRFWVWRHRRFLRRRHRVVRVR